MCWDIDPSPASRPLSSDGKSPWGWRTRLKRKLKKLEEIYQDNLWLIIFTVKHLLHWWSGKAPENLGQWAEHGAVHLGRLGARKERLGAQDGWQGPQIFCAHFHNFGLRVTAHALADGGAAKLFTHQRHQGVEYERKTVLDLIESFSFVVDPTPQQQYPENKNKSEISGMERGKSINRKQTNRSAPRSWSEQLWLQLFLLPTSGSSGLCGMSGRGARGRAESRPCPLRSKLSRASCLWSSSAPQSHSAMKSLNG